MTNQGALGFPGGSDGKKFTSKAGDLCSIPGPGRSPWEGNVLPGEFHGQRSLAGYSPGGCKELDMTERLTYSTPKCLRSTYNIMLRAKGGGLGQQKLVLRLNVRALTSSLNCYSHSLVPNFGQFWWLFAMLYRKTLGVSNEMRSCCLWAKFAPTHCGITE